MVVLSLATHPLILFNTECISKYTSAIIKYSKSIIVLEKRSIWMRPKIQENKIEPRVWGQH